MATVTITSGRAVPVNPRPADMVSLALASVTFFNYYYYVMFAALTLFSYVYKVLNLPYPPGHVASELTIFFLLSLVEALRLFLWRKGNLTDSWPSTLMAILLTAPSLLGLTYFLVWQTYVLRLEVLLVYVEYALEILCFLFGATHFVAILYCK